MSLNTAKPSANLVGADMGTTVSRRAQCADGRTASSLALRSDGTLVGWGSNGYGQTNMSADLVAVVTLAAGASHNLAVTAGGLVTPWIESLYRESDRQRTLTLQSRRGSACQLLSSTNLDQWTPLTTITNPGGRILWTDPATNLAGRFYRTWQLP